MCYSIGKAFEKGKTAALEIDGMWMSKKKAVFNLNNKVQDCACHYIAQMSSPLAEQPAGS